MEPRIVCSANKLSDGAILIGIRHWDSHMHYQLSLMVVDDEAPLLESELTKGHIQGFLDQFGKFYTREEAYIVAEKNSQITRNLNHSTNKLYSEHLY